MEQSEDFSPVYFDPEKYFSKNVLVATVITRDTNDRREFICRKRKVGGYQWFITDYGYTTIEYPISGDDLNEAQSEFELYFGLLGKDDFEVEAGTWYRYPCKPYADYHKQGWGKC